MHRFTTKRTRPHNKRIKPSRRRWFIIHGLFSPGLSSSLSFRPHPFAKRLRTFNGGLDRRCRVAALSEVLDHHRVELRSIRDLRRPIRGGLSPGPLSLAAVCYILHTSCILPSRVTVAVIGPEISDMNSMFTLWTSIDAFMKLTAAWYAWFKVAIVVFLWLWLVASCVMKYIIGLIAVKTLIKQSTKKRITKQCSRVAVTAEFPIVNQPPQPADCGRYASSWLNRVMQSSHT